eukprot:2037520-Prymnesium_polylepis.1
MSHSLPRPGRPPSPREARHPTRRLFGVMSADPAVKRRASPMHKCKVLLRPYYHVVYNVCPEPPTVCIEPELHSRRHVRTLWGARD